MTCPSVAKKSGGSHLFGVGPGEADKTALVQELSKAITFFVLGPILANFHIWTRLIDSFLMMYRFWKCSQEKLHFTPVHTLRQLKRDEALFPPLRRVSSEVRLENCTQVWGWAKFGQRATHSWGKIALHTCSDLFRPVRTCLNQSAIQWPCTPVARCHFFALSNALILRSYVLSWWNCIF